MKLFEEGDVPDEKIVRRFVKEFCGGDVALTSGTGGQNNNHLHIPHPVDNDVQPLCSTGMDIDWIRKDLTVYPLGSKPFCKRCLARAFPDKAAIKIWRNDDFDF